MEGGIESYLEDEGEDLSWDTWVVSRFDFLGCSFVEDVPLETGKVAKTMKIEKRACLGAVRSSRQSDEGNSYSPSMKVLTGSCRVQDSFTGYKRRAIWVRTFWIMTVSVVISAVMLGIVFQKGQLGIYTYRVQMLLKGWLWLMENSLSLMGNSGKFNESSSLFSQPLRAPLLWMAPFTSGGGYSSEAISFVSALAGTGQVHKLRVEQHGDGVNMEFWEGLPDATQKLLQASARVRVAVSESVVVCHSEPGAWHPPLYQTSPCPPNGYGKARYVIGRTMFETDRVNLNHVDRCNRMDEIWVPTDFHMATFARSGVNSSKLVKMVEAVDVDFFDPAVTTALELSASQQLVGPDLQQGSHQVGTETFVFLSIFKWEKRKGWDFLVQSFLEEFSAGDNAVLYLLTNPFHGDWDFGRKIADFIGQLELQKPANGWARVLIQDHHIPLSDLPALYKAVNAFVLPSRGEGWGRPLVEALAMGLPVIATNWSGMTEYMTEENSYPLEIEALEEVSEGPFKGHLWAKPSVVALKVKMRRVFEKREEATNKGRKGRKDMIEKYGPGVVAKQVLDRLRTIEWSLETGGKGES